MKTLLYEITIPEYITRVLISNKRKIIFYNIHYNNPHKKLPKTRKPPQKYLKDQNYVIDRAGYLRFRPTGDKVIANPKAAGTPKYQKINGQDFYSGFGSPFMRIKIVAGIKNQFRPFINRLPIITEFPIQMEMELHTTIDEANWDLDNLWIYTKCIQDLMVELGKIPDDNIQYVTKPASPEFFPVQTQEERKIVFKIYKDDRNLKIHEPVRSKK